MLHRALLNKHIMILSPKQPTWLHKNSHGFASKAISWHIYETGAHCIQNIVRIKRQRIKQPWLLHPKQNHDKCMHQALVHNKIEKHNRVMHQSGVALAATHCIFMHQASAHKYIMILRPQQNHDIIQRWGFCWLAKLTKNAGSTHKTLMILLQPQNHAIFMRWGLLLLAELANTQNNFSAYNYHNLASATKSW